MAWFDHLLGGGVDGLGAGEDVESEVAAALGPFVVLLGEDGADEPDDRGAVGVAKCLGVVTWGDCVAVLHEVIERGISPYRKQRLLRPARRDQIVQEGAYPDKLRLVIKVHAGGV